MSYLYTILYPVTSVLLSIIALPFAGITILLIKHLYCIEHTNNNVDQPNEWTKAFALISSIMYSIGYCSITIVYVTKSVGHTEINSAIQILAIISGISYVLGLFFFHLYLLHRINRHINVYSELIKYPCYFKCKLYRIIYVLLILLVLMYTSFGIIRTVFGSNNTIDKYAELSIFIALCTDLVISIILLVIYIKSIHQVAIVRYAINDDKWPWNDKQHELMLRATRIMIVQCWYIVWSFALYIFAILAVSTQHERDRLFGPIINHDAMYSIGLMVDLSMIVIRDFFTIFALYFGFEFGHSWFERCCCYINCVKNRCHKLIELENGEWKKEEFLTSYQRLDDNAKEVKGNYRILKCCCCPIQVNIKRAHSLQSNSTLPLSVYQ